MQAFEQQTRWPLERYNQQIVPFTVLCGPHLRANDGILKVDFVLQLLLRGQVVLLQFFVELA